MKILMLAVCGAAVAAAQISPAAIEDNNLRQLLSVRRVYVDRLTGGETAAQIRDVLISGLENTKLFVLTEKEERADAILRGAAEDLVFNELHQSSEGITTRMNAGTGHSGSRTSGPYSGIGIGENESDRSTERRHEALAAVRLVNKDGDVIWSTTQESMGAKFRGASFDVSDKIMGKLKEDFERARKLNH